MGLMRYVMSRDATEPHHAGFLLAMNGADTAERAMSIQTGQRRENNGRYRNRRNRVPVWWILRVSGSNRNLCRCDVYLGLHELI